MRLKQLAAAADARWAAKPSFLDPPSMQKPAPALGVKDPGGYAGQTEPESTEGVRNAVASPEEVRENAAGREVDKGRFRGETREKSPFDMQKGGPSEAWQPQAWTPRPTQRQ